MALESGTRLGHYEVTDLLGKGGMGEVYRARDTKLGREVAIKVLPSEFARDEERLARLEREARMLAALNHPNIAAIHGLEEADDTRFLVLELVEGDTLADRLKSGAIPVEESLKLALQIAEALEAAHEKGVIHRDLKPANIKITPEGRVKVLDFGLAKAFIGDAADVNLSNSPTLSMQATQQGVILGTAGYMSPEQARGETADHRSDVWAFGVVLFEMLSGGGTFDGKTVSDILASVLKTDPAWQSLPPNLHPRLRLLLERCLEKEPKDRYSGISDARVDIRKVLADPGGVFVQSVAQAADAPRASRLPWVAATVSALLIGGAAVWWLTPPVPRPVSRWDYTLPDTVNFRNMGRSIVSISPDGSSFVYNGTGGLYLRFMDELEARPVSGTEAALTNPTFSPDGQWIAFWSPRDQQLKKIAVVGGTAVTLTDQITNPFGLSWEQDGTILYSSGSDGIMRVSEDGGQPELIADLTEEAFGGTPQLLPGGRAILTSTQGAEIAVYSIDSGESKRLFPGSGGRFVPTGQIVYAEGNALFAVPFDVDRLEVTGGPVPLVEGVEINPPQYSVSDNGTLIYVRGSGSGQNANTVLTWVDRDGTRTALPVVPRPYLDPKLSPDGTRLVVQTTESGESDVWVYDLDGETQMQQVTGGGDNIRPIWTPDGERLTFTSDRDGTQRIYWQASDLSGTATPLTPSEPGVIPHADSWSPDGRTLSFAKTPQPRSVWTVTLDEEGQPGEPEFFVGGGEGGQEAFSSAFAPVGGWLAYLAQATIGEEELFIEPFPQTGIRFQLTQNGGSNPLWSRDGRELFYRRGFGVDGLAGGQASSLFKVDITLDTTPRFSNEQAMPIQGFIVTGTREYDITPDGERLIMVYPSNDARTGEVTRPQINVVENWFQELRERVPVP